MENIQGIMLSKYLLRRRQLVLLFNGRVGYLPRQKVLKRKKSVLEDIYTVEVASIDAINMFPGT